MTKKFAFTLAEVLIALAIIGVVAAMTIPTFMANTAGAQFRTGFKKGITVLTQAASANYATEGYDFAGTTVAYGGYEENGVYIAKPVSTAGTASEAGSLNGDTTSRIGFNTVAPATVEQNFDLEDRAQSLFHLFQNNLNMKNSNEVVNYDVGMPDVALDCQGEATINLNTAQRAAEGFQATSIEGRGRGVLSGHEGSPQAVGTIADLCGGRSLANGGINQGRMFALEDGMVFTYDAGQISCTENNPCFGYIDINGPQGPNKVISCSSGNNSYIKSYGSDLSITQGRLLSASCTVDAKDITDIYPVLFYNSTVKPASLAAKAVLYSQKSNQPNDN